MLTGSTPAAATAPVWRRNPRRFILIGLPPCSEGGNALGLCELLKLRARQRFHERDEIVDLLLREIERPYSARKERIHRRAGGQHAAVVVMLDDLAQRRDAAVVHVWQIGRASCRERV